MLVGWAVADISPVLAQAFSDGGTIVDVPSPQANCTVPLAVGGVAGASACFYAANPNSVLRSSTPLTADTTGSPGPDVSGVLAFDGGTVNLTGGTIIVGQEGAGLSAGHPDNLAQPGTGGTITASNLTFRNAAGATSASFIDAKGADSAITLSGTTDLMGTTSQSLAALSAADGAAITFAGPVQASGAWGTFALAVARATSSGGRIDFNGGGTITGTGNTNTLFQAQFGTITMTGMTVQAMTNAALTSLLTVVDGGTITANNSTLTGSNSGGNVYGIDLQWVAASGAPGNVSLDNSRLTMQSPGSAILVTGIPVATVTLTNGSTVTGFGSANDSLISVTDNNSQTGNLTLNATNSTLTGNILVHGVDSFVLRTVNVLNLNLTGSSSWTGDLTGETGLNGIPAQANVGLAGSARWTGTATNATNVSLGFGTAWTVTADSSVVQSLGFGPIGGDRVGGNVLNGGTIAFATGGAFKTLTTFNYVGQGGALVLNTQLGGDDSPSDQLVIDGGSATGSTLISVNNIPIPGGSRLTTGNGIPVVVAQNGGTTAADAFHLGGIVASGAFQYQLFKGSVSSGTPDEQNTWYLRNSLIPTPAPGPGPGPNPPAPPIPLYRPEVPLYASMAGMARSLNMLTIGTFHERNGDQGLVRGQDLENGGTSDRIWGRVFGQASEISHAGTVSGRAEGNAGGVQSGADIYRVTSPTYDSRFGLFGSYAQARGDVSGFALGQQGAAVGNLQVEAYSVGGYWTHIGAPGWYIDAVVMGSRFDGGGRSINQVGVRTDGYGVAASLESGYPIALGGGVRLEPQAQLVYQHLAFDDTHDGLSSIAHDTSHALAGRLGLRLAADTVYWGARLSPFLKASVWQDWTGTDQVVFAGIDMIEARQRGTSVEVGGGITARLANNIGLWASADYTTDVAGDGEREIVRGNLGLRVTW